MEALALIILVTIWGLWAGLGDLALLMGLALMHKLTQTLLGLD